MMFGCLTANKKEFSGDELQIYHSYYCGLCQELKRQTGNKGRLLVTYDMTFLALVLSGLYEPEEADDRFVCPLHPGRTRKARRSSAMEYASSMDILLSYYDLLDDWADDRSFPAKRLADSIRKKVEEISRLYPDQALAVTSYVKALAKAEAGQEENPDLAAGLTGSMLGRIFQWKGDDVWGQDLWNMGYYLGKFIYLMDAWEDREDDEKRGSYNPLIGRQKASPTCYETWFRQNLTSQIAECTRAFERLPILKNASIIRNVLYSGIWGRYDVKRLETEKRMGKKG